MDKHHEFTNYQAKQLFTLWITSTCWFRLLHTARGRKKLHQKSIKALGREIRFAGGRGKVGSVKSLNLKKEIHLVNTVSKRLVLIIGNANGQPVTQILVEAATDIAKELYLGGLLTVVPSCCLYGINEGGVEIEK